jgi:uncharacterized protein (TIGR03437 family)
MKRGRVVAWGLLLLPAAFGQTVSITAPANNKVVAPGQTVAVTVTLSPATSFAAVSLYGASPLGLIGAQAATSSATFSLTLPTDLKPATYPITAIGYPTTGMVVISQSVTLLVEQATAPVSLNANPAQLFFNDSKSTLPVMAGGAMADGTFVNLTESPQMTWTSSNTAVATVSTDGQVTSVGNGTATVTAKLGSLSAAIAVNVSAPAVPCVYGLASSSANAGSSGSTVTVNVTTNSATCEWSAVSWVPWVSVTGGTLGLGAGPVTLSVAGNSGAARSGNVSIAGQNFGISQVASTGVTTVPSIANNGVVNGASFVTGGVVPGEIATIFGTNLTTATGINLASALPLATQLLNVQVLVNGTAAPIFAVDNVNGQQQINFQVPYEVAVKSTATLQVVNNGSSGNAIAVPVIAAQPGIFTYAAGSTTYGAILHADYQLANTSNPAIAGETVQIFCTGLGAVTPTPADGAAAAGASMTVATATVTIGGIAAAVAYAGLAPGYVGLYQINAQVPTGLSSGNQPVVITIRGAQSTIAMLPVQ